MGEVTVRRAVAADAADVARVVVTGWHEAYTGRMPQSILDRLDVAELTKSWRRIISREDGAGEVWVAERDESVIGFAAAGASGTEGAPAGQRQLYAIYILAAHYGSGAGQTLLDAAIGESPAMLWILDDNPRARAFYERNGFRADGTFQDDDQWGEPVREVRMVRPAQESPNPQPAAEL